MLTKEQRLVRSHYIGLILMHLGSLCVIFTGASLGTVLIAFLLYQIRSMGIMCGYHRYFSHRSFKAKRITQFFLALMGSMAGQGPLVRWVSHHIIHHKETETEADLHSPKVYGFYRAHVGWMLQESCFKKEAYPGLKNRLSPEVLWLDKNYNVLFVLQALLIYLLGSFLEIYFPALQTSGPQLLVVGFFLSLTIALHATFCVNSVCHLFGSRDYNTSDDSKNNFWVALLTNGEGWHNNHHAFPRSAKSGLKWWQIDLAYNFLKILESLNLVSDLLEPSKEEIDLVRDTFPEHCKTI
jgi:stearoyl-CoA desaturase (Delta-9 desaturase)